jgi:uncharacterized protein with HEPN domain
LGLNPWQVIATGARSKLGKSDRTFDAVMRNLQIIGEAAKNVPTQTRLRYPEVE